MKKLIILSAAVIALMLNACNSSSNKTEQPNSTDVTEQPNSTDVSTFHSIDTTQLKAGDTFYQCEMNPEVISSDPGTCPKCGMDLVKFKKK